MGYDITFMDTDSEFRSYFLGLYMTDGWMDNSRGLYISLSDEQIINDIVEKTQYTNKILNITSKTIYGEQNMFRIAYCNLYDAFINIGFPIKKTGNEFIPKEISDDTFCHFLRGLSDGDGCFYLSNGTKRKDGTYNQYLQWEITCASKEFLYEVLNNITKHIGENNIRVEKRSGTIIPVFRLRCNKHNEAINLAKFMYKNNTIKLNRKYDLYKSVENIVVKELKPWTKEEILMLYNNMRPPNRSPTNISNKKRSLSLNKVKHQ